MLAKSNPIKKRLQAESIKRLAETFLGKKNFSWLAIFYASLLFLISNWFPDGIADLLKGECREGSYKVIVSVSILLFIGYKLQKALKYEGEIEVRCDSPSPNEVLAIFLSPLVRKFKSADVAEALQKDSLLEKLFEGSEWEMPMVAIRHHLPRLKFLYVFTSPGESGTSMLMPLFKKTIERLFPSLEVIELKMGGIDFEDVKEVFNAIKEFYKNVKQKGFTEEHTIVDITGGQKTNSIAGAIATLAKDRKFQYVSTKDKRVLSYDVGYFEEEREI